jgi:hypothetical protein
MNELVDGLIVRGRLGEAIPLLRALLREDGSDPLQECRDRMRLARCLAESGDLHAAVDACTPLLPVIDRMALQRCLPAIRLKVTLVGVLTMRGDLVTAPEIRRACNVSLRDRNRGVRRVASPPGRVLIHGAAHRAVNRRGVDRAAGP